MPKDPVVTREDLKPFLPQGVNPYGPDRWQRDPHTTSDHRRIPTGTKPRIWRYGPDGAWSAGPNLMVTKAMLGCVVWVALRRACTRTASPPLMGSPMGCID